MPNEKDKKNKSLIVKDNRLGILESLLNSLPPEKRQEISNKAAEEVVNIEIEALEKKRHSDRGMEDMRDVLNEFGNTPHDKVTDFIQVTSKHKTGSGEVEIKARKGVGCFVATIAFDSSEAEEVCCLRDFRDNVLCNFVFGRRFINWYYRNGPMLAKIVARYQPLKWPIRKTLSFLVCAWKAIR